MKNWLLKVIIGLTILLPLAAFAGECEDPTGNLYQSDTNIIFFDDAYCYAFNKTWCHYPYTFNADTCTAIIDSIPAMTAIFNGKEMCLFSPEYYRFTFKIPERIKP